MSITRAPLRSEQPYTVFANELLNDELLSADALGVLVYLVSKPPNWTVMPGKVGERFGCGRDKVYRILADLIDAGYVTSAPARDAAGIIRGWKYLVSNEKNPLPENTEVDGELPLPEIATSGKSAPQKKDNLKKERDHRPAKLKKDEPYSEDFQAIWQQYPRTKNTSKSKAWGLFRMLNAENQQLVRVAVPQYAEAMRRENRPEDKIKHMQFWLSDRMYETAAPAPTAPNGSTPPTKRFWEYATEKQWANILLVWSTNWQWSESWGPAPDKPGCHVPQNLLDRFDLKYRGHLFSPEEKAAKRERVNMQLTQDQPRA
jgi:hypothetical protein